MIFLPLALKHYANQIDSLEDCTWHPHPFHRISPVILTMIGRITLSGDGGWVGKGWPRAPLAPPPRPPPPPTSPTLPTTLSHPGKVVLLAQLRPILYTYMVRNKIRKADGSEASL